jgi:GntR family transcriptional regulator
VEPFHFAQVVLTTGHLSAKLYPVLDTGSPLPLYHQLAEQLQAQIQAGTFAPGHKIPSEHELAASYGVGRPTVRQATDALIQRGLLLRKRGSGTFVRNAPAQVDLFSLAGTLVSFERGGLQLTSRLLGRPQRHEVEASDHPMSGQQAIRLVRVSRLLGLPVLLEEFDFAAEHFADLPRLPLQGRSLSELVEHHYRMRPLAADQSFRVLALDPTRARTLELARGTAILCVDRTLHFARAQAAVFVRMYCRTDQLVFSQRISGGNTHA